MRLAAEIIDKLTVVPPQLVYLFGNDFETFKAELKDAVKSLNRNEELMAQMFTDQTEASMKAIRLEVAEIAKHMNGVMRKRFTKPDGTGDYKGMMMWGTLMAIFSSQDTLSDEQRELLLKTGALRDLLHARVTS
jgi:hypothetical protein